jgi:hypothetical protein
MAGHRYARRFAGISGTKPLEGINGDRMKPVVIIAAVPQEIELLEMALEHFGRVKTGGFEYFEGSIGKLRVVFSVGGVGKANAAAAAAVMIDRYQPQLVINTGCAGAYIGSGLAVGNLVVASEEVLADEGVIVAGGWKDLRYMNIPSVEQGGLDCYNLLPLSRHASPILFATARLLTVPTTSSATSMTGMCENDWAWLIGYSPGPITRMRELAASARHHASLPTAGPVSHSP